MKGADADAAQKAWTEVETAVQGLSDDTPLMQAAGTIMGPVQGLLSVVGELSKLVGDK